MAQARTGLAEAGARATYGRLSAERQQYTTRAEDNATLTIPQLFPKQGDNGSTKYTQPYQSAGAYGLNALSSKLKLALFPQATWMRLDISEWLLKIKEADPAKREEAQAALAQIERILMKYMEGNSYDTVLQELIKQHIVAGNALLVLPEPSGTYTPPKLYKLSSYVCERDAYGNVLQIIAKDTIAHAAVPQDIRDKLPGEHKPEDQLELYTHWYLDEESNQYLKYEELEGVEIEGTDASYPLDALPAIASRLIRQDGENYGRSYVEEFYGDLQSLEKLTKAVVNMAMISSKVVGLVKPGSQTQPRRLAQAQTGDFVPGLASDISFLQLDKTVDFNIANKVMDKIEARLQYAFLNSAAVQRNGDRVTAEEIRTIASELESTLSGIYTSLNQELQLPIVRVLLNQLQAAKQIQQLPKEAITPSVVTGQAALGRGQDKNNLMEFIQVAPQILAMDDSKINTDVLVLRYANTVNVDTDGLIPTAEERAQKLAQQTVATGAENFGGQLGAGAAAQATASPDAMNQAADNAGLEPAQVS